ncbi:MAG: ABC transporter permease [Vicinamibacteria bacterium]|nr:ABC transporter permease [Vicinamibacteria bacterium]
MLRVPEMTGALQEMKVAARRLRKAPATSLLVIAILGVVLGANTLAFSFVNGIVLNPLPTVANKVGLVNVHRRQNDKDSVQGFSYPAYRALSQTQEFENGLVGFNGRGLSLERNGTPQLVFGMLVSANYFDALGVRPSFGRSFAPQDDIRGGAGVVVLSDAIFRTRFGGDEAVVGSSIHLNGRSFTVIGIGPPRFTGQFVGFAADLWVPLSWAPELSGQADLLENPATEWLEAFGRLKPGSSSAVAAALTRIQQELPRVNTGNAMPDRILIEPMTGIDRDLRGPVMALLALFQSAAALVAMIALLNISSLLLARSLERGPETAVRLALGASRRHLLAPLAFEALLLCGLGAALGGVLSVVGARVAPAWLPPFAIPIRFDLALDGRTFAFSLLTALVGATVATIAPGLADARRRASAVLRDGGPQRTARSRWRAALLVTQVASATAILICGSALTRFLERTAADSPGFDIGRVQITRLDTSTLGRDAGSGRLLQRRAIEAITALPGVERIGFASAAPYGLGTPTLQARNPALGPTAPWFKAQWNAVSPGFFETIDVRPARGRTFSSFDRADAPRVVVINQSLATRLFPEGDAVGRVLSIGPGDETAAVVGVVPDLSLRRLGEEPGPQLFRPFDQAPSPRLSILTRSSHPEALASLIRPALALATPDLPLLESIPLREFASFSQTGARLGSRAGLALGSLGLGLAALGLFGLALQAVASRVREIAIRMAMGAPSSRILELVLREGGTVTLGGVCLGLLGALGASPLLSLVAPSASVDPLTAAGASGVVIVTTAAALIGPAWRATRVAPAIALRGH